MDDGVNIRRMIKAKALITKKTLHEREGKEDFVGFATGLSREYGAGVKNNEGCAIFMTQPLSVFWWREEDSNLRPLGYEPNELPLLHPAMFYVCKGTTFILFCKLFNHIYLLKIITTPFIAAFLLFSCAYNSFLLYI